MNYQKIDNEWVLTLDPLELTTMQYLMGIGMTILLAKTNPEARLVLASQTSEMLNSVDGVMQTMATETGRNMLTKIDSILDNRGNGL